MLLGLDRVAMAGGGLSAKSYKGSIVAQWDGIENAGYGSHADTLSVWKNLKGTGDCELFENYTGTAHTAICLSSSLDWDGSFRGDVSNATEIQTALNDFDYAIEYCFFTESTVNNSAIFANYDNYSNLGLWMYLSADKLDTCKMSGGITDVQSVTGVKNNLITLCLTNSGIYKNGTKITNLTFGTTNVTANFCIGALGFQWNGWIGKIHSIRIHGSHIDAADIAENSNTDQARFS